VESLTVAQLKALIAEGKVKNSHTSRQRGYISRKSEGVVSDYSGKFGKGYKHLTACYDSSQYCYVTY